MLVHLKTDDLMHTHGLFLNALKLDYPHPWISVPAFFTIDGFPQALERNLGHCEIPLGVRNVPG